MDLDTQHTSDSGDSGDDRFASTRWSIVLDAGRGSSPSSAEALATLCRTYWYPLYAYVRRRVNDVHEAQDLTQAFFARLLEKDCVSLADPERGRFRSFLLTAMKHFLANEWSKARAQKHGGGQSHLTLDFEAGESRYRIEPVDLATPESLYDEQWALALLDRVFETLRDEYRRSGKEKQFEILKIYITAHSSRIPYAEVGGTLNMTENAVSVAVHRLRRRYREMLRWEIAQTVATPEDVDDEIRSLFASLGA